MSSLPVMPSHLEELIAALRCLPGVGPKSAQRMAYHLLQRDRAGALHLAQKLGMAVSNIQHCSKCNNFSEQEVCGLCASPKRDTGLLCVVEMPADLLMMEQAQCYRGMYFVLMGRLSPLDGIGANELQLERLVRRVQELSCEVILATNFTGGRRCDRALPRNIAAGTGRQSVAHRARIAGRR